MAQLAAAIFDRREDAQRAVHALRDHGVSEDNISILAIADDGSGKISDMEASERITPPGKDEGISATTPADALKGAMGGAAIGTGLGIAATLASIMIPGFGLVTAGGALLTAMGGGLGLAASGAATGGVLGYLMDLGADQQAAHHYSEEIKRGGVFVSVHDTDDIDYDDAQELFAKYGGRGAGEYADMPLGAASNISNPDELDATNRRLTGDGAFNDNKNAGLDAVTGSEGSASSRLSNDEVGMATANIDSGVQPRTADYGSTAEGSSSDMDTMAGGTERGFGNATIAGQVPSTPGRTFGSPGVSDQIGAAAGTTGTDVGGPGPTANWDVAAPVGGRGETGGGSNANMGTPTGIAGSGTAGGTSPQVTTGDLGITDRGATGDLGATTAGPQGDFGTLRDQEVAATAGGAITGASNDIDTTERGMTGMRTDTAAVLAGSAGGATLGANDGGIGDLESASRPDEANDNTPRYDLDAADTANLNTDDVREDVEDIIEDRVGSTSVASTGGTTNTGTTSGGSGITTSGGSL